MSASRRRRWPWLLGGLLIVGLWSAVAAVSLLQARTQLQTGRDAVVAGRAALLVGDVGTAEEELERGREAFDAGEARLSNVFVRSFGVLAPLHDDLTTARALAVAGGLVAEAGEEVAATVVGFPGGLAALEPEGGGLPVGRIDALAAPLRRAEALLAEAGALVAATPDEGLTAQVADARATFIAELADARGLVEPAATLASVLPDFLGADGPRRYFFAAQNPAELRGTGGFMGAFAILTLDDGRLSFGDFREIHELPNGDLAAVVPPSAEFAERFNRYGGAAFWQNINMTMDFPSAAIAIERLYAQTVGDELDGVIAADPFALQALLEIAGPIDVPLIGQVTADSVVDVMTNGAYAVYEDPAERKAVLGGVAAGALQGFLHAGIPQGSRVAALRALAAAADDGHLLVHAVDADEQAAFLGTGIAGALGPVPGHLVGIAVNNAAANKVDYYTQRTVRYDVSLRDDGTADGRLTVTFRNESPTSGVPGRVIGGGRRELEPGDNRSLVSVYCSAPCALQSGPPDLLVESELGHAVFTSDVRLASGADVVLSYDWLLPTGWDAEAGRYRLTLQGQPTVPATRGEVVIHPPDGLVVTATSQGLDVGGEALRWDGELGREATFEVALSPPPAAPAAPGSPWQRLRSFFSRPLLRFPG